MSGYEILLENTGFREKELMLAGARLPAAVPEGDVKSDIKQSEVCRIHYCIFLTLRLTSTNIMACELRTVTESMPYHLFS
jgi:hypothetical protein